MSRSVICGKEGRLLAAALSLTLAFSQCLPALAQEEPAATYEEYLSGENRDRIDVGQYETVRIANVEQLRELADSCRLKFGCLAASLTDRDIRSAVWRLSGRVLRRGCSAICSRARWCRI